MRRANILPYAIILILVASAASCLAANNIYGVQLLNSPPDSLDWAKSLTGDGGYAKDLFYGISNSTSGPSSGWVNFVNQCYARNLIPVCRLATHYNDGVWNKPVADSPGDYTSFANAVKRVVQGLPRNDTYPLYIEVLNEVNSAIEWSNDPDPEEYAHCLVDVAAAIRSIGDSRIKIMNAGMAGGASFADEMFAAVPASLWAWDVWASHCYSLNRPPEHNKHNGYDYDITIDMYLDELAVIESHGRTGVQVMITETGYALGDHTWTHYPVIDEENRADYIVRAFRDYWGQWPEVLAVTPFEFCDEGWLPYNWVYPGSGTEPDGRPTQAHQQYYDVWNLAKPNMSRGAISGKVTEASFDTELVGATVTLNPGDTRRPRTRTATTSSPTRTISVLSHPEATASR